MTLSNKIVSLVKANIHFIIGVLFGIFLYKIINVIYSLF